MEFESLGLCQWVLKTAVFNQRGKIFSGANKGLITIFSSSCKCGRMLSAYRLILSTTEPEQIQWLSEHLSQWDCKGHWWERWEEMRPLCWINYLFASKSHCVYSNAMFLKGATIPWLVQEPWSKFVVSIQQKKKKARTKNSKFGSELEYPWESACC